MLLRLYLLIISSEATDIIGYSHSYLINKGLIGIYILLEHYARNL